MNGTVISLLQLGLSCMRIDLLILLTLGLIAIQFLLCLKIKNKWIHLLPILIFPCTFVVLFLIAVLIEGWEGLALIVFAIHPMIALLTYAIGRGLWYIGGIFFVDKRLKEKKLSPRESHGHHDDLHEQTY